MSRLIAIMNTHDDLSHFGTFFLFKTLWLLVLELPNIGYLLSLNLPLDHSSRMSCNHIHILVQVDTAVSASSNLTNSTRQRILIFHSHVGSVKPT